MKRVKLFNGLNIKAKGLFQMEHYSKCLQEGIEIGPGSIH